MRKAVVGAGYTVPKPSTHAIGASSAPDRNPKGHRRRRRRGAKHESRFREASRPYSCLVPIECPRVGSLDGLPAFTFFRE
jgi:hypothetical protein